MQQRENIILDLPDLELVFVEGGTFMMGSNDGQDRERPVHQVTVPSFYLSRYLVTQRLWQMVMGDNPSRFKGEKQPVENVSWEDTHRFIQQLNEQTDRIFRLPTEAEWEYAARGGKYSQGYIYAGSDKLKQVGWYAENSNGKTHDVGLLLANELGIYDMSGNVYEWCEDDFHENYQGAPDDGSAWIDQPKRGVDRVLRGGSFGYNAVYCRSAYRNRSGPGYRYGGIGFRVVLPLQSVG